jgi:hypothetical protein
MSVGEKSVGGGTVYLAYNNSQLSIAQGGNHPSNGSTLDIPIYTDSSMSTLIGTITLHINR